jgi:hypothetical protein
MTEDALEDDLGQCWARGRALGKRVCPKTLSCRGARLIDSEDEREIVALMEQIVDPVGTFYRYSLPASLLHRRTRNLSSSPAEAGEGEQSR